jgi:lipopolysaccharide/colanic/teichoic acid biosynthesis glycosyltransferase
VLTLGPKRRPVERAVKRVIDVVVAAAGLTLGAPLLAVIAAAVAIESPGGALFLQERVGRHGRLYRIVKFRTLRAGAPMRFEPGGATLVAADDDRVTRVGRCLRGALDELPQLWNVLRGDMSLVGPRPDLPVHAAAYTDAERRKLDVRPGMTSLVAILGRDLIPWRTRIAIDLRYVDRWSLALDLKIAVQTLLLPLGARPFRFADTVEGLEIRNASAARTP